jgi:hypothetical protein
VLQARGEPDFPLESLRANRLGDLGVENLERDGAVMAQVMREVDGGEPAAAKLAVYAVAVAQGGFEVVAGGQVRSTGGGWGTLRRRAVGVQQFANVGSEAVRLVFREHDRDGSHRRGYLAVTFRLEK